jgi:hypothetical protein
MAEHSEDWRELRDYLRGALEDADEGLSSGMLDVLADVVMHALDKRAARAKRVSA